MKLHIKNLTLKHNGRYLINNINFYIESYKTTILFGRSGSGKTLTTLSIQGLIPNNITKVDGRFYLNETEINPDKSRAKIFASIMQNPQTCFNPLYSINSHIKESVNATKIKCNQNDIESALKEVNLDINVLNLYPFEMSGGMLQRIMIALALLTKAPFIIADEPTTSLDLIAQYKILKILKRLQKNNGIGILLITHDIEVALKMADNIIIMQDGKIQETFELTPAININAMKHEYSKILVSKYLHKINNIRQ